MDSEPTTPSIRRSFSLPVARQPSSPDPQIEVLFNLASAKIVAFTTSNAVSGPDSRPDSSNGSPAREPDVGTLSWVSRFERTIAVGALRIYRAPGSVAFLNCANALKPILPKSQAWCVDGDSKFVLQIRPPQYWRLEVPNKTAEDLLKVEELKRTLEEVLRFEKTPCPFQRNFTVELPKAPEAPIKKKLWQPAERPKVISASSSVEDLRTLNQNLSCSPTWGSTGSKSRSPSPLSALDEDMASITSEIETQNLDHDTNDLPSKSTDDRMDLRREPSRGRPPKVMENVNLEPSPLKESPIIETIVYGDLKNGGDNHGSFIGIQDTNRTPRSYVQPSFQPLTSESKKDDKPQALQGCSRSITAPPVLSLVTSPPSRHRSRSISPPRPSTSASNSIGLDSGFSSSVESFHSVQSWHSPLDPPSPYASRSSSPSSTYPYPHENIVRPKRLIHPRDESEMTIVPETPRNWERIATVSAVESSTIAASPTPKTPTLTHEGSEKSDEEQAEVLTPPAVRPTIRHRATTSSNSRRRTLSPLPAAVNLFSPPKRNSRKLKTARHLPTAIIQKTYEILLSPPSHLFHLMISIATKIAAGEWRGFLSGHGEAVHWDLEDDYGGLFEDDYGVSLPKGPKPTSNGSGEVD